MVSTAYRQKKITFITCGRAITVRMCADSCKLPRAANIRKIEAYKDGALMFDELLGLMNVTFVHNGQLTVLPFPFKYLREYVNR